MKIYIVILVLIITSISRNVNAQFVEKSTDVLSVVPSAVALGVVIVNHDRTGLKQLVFSSASAIVINYALEFSIEKQRPDGSGNHSFPSTHTLAAFNGATFLAIRYGWKLGIPAYATACYVGWGRVEANRHDWWDVLAGAAIGTGTAFIFTRPFKISDAEVSIVPYSGVYNGVNAIVRF